MNNFYHYLVMGATRANVLTYNATDFNKQLDNAHTKIDTRHDQEDATRSSTMIRTDSVYATNLRAAVMMNDSQNLNVNINGTDYAFQTDSIHRLAEALKRKDGDASFTIGTILQQMPEYKILSGDGLYALARAQSPGGTFAGMQLEVKPFNPAPGGRDAALTEIRRLYGPGANSFVNDCGSSAAYTVATTPQQGGGGGGRGETSVLSGVGDSSSTTAMLPVQEFQDWHQTFIPFMRHANGEVVYVYATPYHNNQIFLWFSLLQDDAKSQAIQGQILSRTRQENLLYFSNDSVNGNRATPAGGPQPYLGVAIPWNNPEGGLDGAWTILGKVNDNRNDPLDQDIPNLPDVSNYIASEWWNQTSKCLDIFIKRDSVAVQQKCLVFFEIAKLIFGITTPFVRGSDEYFKVVCFIMYIKHFGDRWRGIDSLLLSEASKRGAATLLWNALTGTFDSFLIRWMVLGGMYGLYINKGTNLILSDIRAPLTEAQTYAATLRAYNVIYGDYFAMYNLYSNVGGGPQTAMGNQIFGIAEWFAVFFQKAGLHQPRGARFRKIASLVAPKSFSTEMFKPPGKSIGTYVYREEEMAILWTCFQMLWILMVTSNQLPEISNFFKPDSLVNPNSLKLDGAGNFTKEQGISLDNAYTFVTKDRKETIDNLRKAFVAYTDSERVLGLFNSMTSPYTNANMLLFASRVVKVMKISVSEYAPSGTDIVPWGLDTGQTNAINFISQFNKPELGTLFTFSGGGSNQVIKQTGGDIYHDEINTIKELLKKQIRTVIHEHQGTQNIGFTYSYDISQGTGYSPHLYIFWNGSQTGEPFGSVQLPSFNHLYNDIQNYYCDTKREYQMFEPETFEELRHKLYFGTNTITDVQRAIYDQHITRAVLEEHADDGYVHENDDDADQAVAAANSVTQQIAFEQEPDNAFELIDILSNLIVLDIIDKIDADENIITDAINEATDMTHDWKRRHKEDKNHTMTNKVHTGNVSVPRVAGYNVGGGQSDTEHVGNINDFKRIAGGAKEDVAKKDENPRWEVLFNKKAYRDAMSKFTTLCRNNAEKMEDCYGDEPFTDENYIKYLESKIALDKYYLSLYDNEALEPRYVNCTEEEFSAFFDNKEKEVDAETDIRMLKNTIKNYQESIEQIKKDIVKEASVEKAAADRMAAIKKRETLKHTTFIGPDGKPLSGQKPKYKPVNMKTGLTASEIAEMGQSHKNEFNKPHLMGYGGKTTHRKRKTLKKTKRTKKRRYVTKTAHKKKTKNANRSKKNNTRRKRHY